MSYKVPEEFIITRQGKQYVLYGGLLDAAHAQGLKSIETSLEQIPSPDNDNVAIVTAVVQMEEEPDREVDTIVHRSPKLFTGIGDASPRNVGKNIVEHIIRMAETRAKARALRDAVDIGGLMLADDPSEASEAESVVSQSAGALASPELSEVRASAEQQNYLKGLLERLERAGVQDARAQFEHKHQAISGFTPEKASYWIERLGVIVDREEHSSASGETEGGK